MAPWRSVGLPPSWRILCSVCDGGLLCVGRRSVNDIDVYAGAMSEQNVPGGQIGPTFGCILARQFRNSRAGDRFWYENSPRPMPGLRSGVGFSSGRRTGAGSGGRGRGAFFLKGFQLKYVHGAHDGQNQNKTNTTNKQDAQGH